VLEASDVVWLRRGGSREQAVVRPLGQRLETPLAAGSVITPQALSVQVPATAGRA
jgi:hypothetical protein